MHFVVHMNPKPCPRPRVAMRGKYPTAYYPKPYTDWKAEFNSKLLEKVPDNDEPVFTGPVYCKIINVMVKPRTGKLDVPPYDVDNYAKSVMDGITNHKGVWKDDDQVAELDVAKVYGDINCICVEIEDLPVDSLITKMRKYI